MKQKETLVKAIGLAFLVASIVTNYLDLDFSGILTAVAAPLCIIGVYLSLRPKKEANGESVGGVFTA
jgi:hypothetical protein